MTGPGLLRAVTGDHGEEQSVDPILLKPDEAAQVLRVSRSKIYEMAAAGILPCVFLGTAVRIPTDALRRWVEQQIKTGREVPVPPVQG